MKLLTLDMGVNIPHLQERLDALGSIIQAEKPAFVALQNVSNETIKKVGRTPWGALYSVVHPPYVFETRTKPTVALFSIYPPQDSETVSYHENGTNKVLQKAYYVMYDKQKKAHVICISTTLLEDGLKQSDIRERQLNEAFLSLHDDEDAFVLGNFNLDNDIDGDLELYGGWTDAWLSIAGNTATNGPTYDPVKNTLVKDDPFGCGRPDRIFFKTRRYKLDSVEVVGKEPYQPTVGKAVHASTHFGLLAKFSPLEQCLPASGPCMVACTFKRTQWSLQFQQSN